MEIGVLAEELTCSVCLELFQDPVALPCQHSFCAKCINDAWDHLETLSGVSCPQCRQTFSPRPRLVKNHSLQNIVEKYNRHPPVAATSAQTVPVTCEYCIITPTQAVKTCLKCETSFCSRHLQPHLTKQIYKEHCLIEPTADLTRRQCPSHGKVLEFYCEQDEVCVCMSCTIVGDHKSHSLLSLEQAKDKLKEKIHMIQKEWLREQGDLKQSENEIKRHSKEVKGKLSAAFSEWRKQLEKDEKLALKMIDEEANRLLSQIKSSSDSLLKKMEEVQIIGKDAQDQDQNDPLFFIQNVKQRLSRPFPFEPLQAAVNKQELNPTSAPVFGSFASSTNFRRYAGDSKSDSDSDSDSNAGLRCVRERDQQSPGKKLEPFRLFPFQPHQATVTKQVIKPYYDPIFGTYAFLTNFTRNAGDIKSTIDSDAGLRRVRERDQHTPGKKLEPFRATEPKRVTLNVSAVRTVIQNKFREYQRYQTTILQALEIYEKQKNPKYNEHQKNVRTPKPAVPPRPPKQQ
ncbi:E3 ubiquitin/ISG15 ligase TRIM25-like [Hypanus sabinus]|uniref:E3 ubiquitin/ISG15 ligase TRIM25-like n=1 Tax=Hypanus sabinus TaxID=79690 RepID=UPI0028C3B9DA|nr:E3 ubiquitin/ISG15 ligase TRIM25-like [Hypanus sabinus]